GVGVRRIIASDDPNYPLQDGDLLILINVPRDFTDFSEYDTGDFPSDWTMPWATADATVVADASATGGKVLRVVNPDAVRRAFSWTQATDKALQSDIIELAYKWRTNNLNGGVRAIVRGSGSAG